MYLGCHDDSYWSLGFLHRKLLECEVPITMPVEARFLEPAWTSLPGRIKAYLSEIGFSSGADICNILRGGDMEDIL